MGAGTPGWRTLTGRHDQSSHLLQLIAWTFCLAITIAAQREKSASRWQTRNMSSDSCVTPEIKEASGHLWAQIWGSFNLRSQKCATSDTGHVDLRNPGDLALPPAGSSATVGMLGAGRCPHHGVTSPHTASTHVCGATNSWAETRTGGLRQQRTKPSWQVGWKAVAPRGSMGKADSPGNQSSNHLGCKTATSQL